MMLVQTPVELAITEIIDSCHYGEEMFFTDSREAAKLIIAYLVFEKIIILKVNGRA